MNPRRTAGIGLIVFAVGSAIGFSLLGSPGGDYSSTVVESYIASGHWPVAFALSYLGALSALGLLVFARGLRDGLVPGADTVWGLSVAGTAASVVGWFVVGGLDVSMAEGGAAVQAGVPHEVVYTISEIGNLLAVCSPAFFVGVAALVLAVKGSLTGWLRVFSIVAGVCGIFAPAYFTYFLFLLWAIVFGATLAASRRQDRVVASAV
jgi:hypothetical protein